MTGIQTSAEVQHWIDRNGWAPALERIANEAPPVPDGALEILRATGFPVPSRSADDRRAS